jgi:hypothetical protein
MAVEPVEDGRDSSPNQALARGVRLRLVATLPLGSVAAISSKAAGLMAMRIIDRI